jgi:hypothetical protein
VRPRRCGQRNNEAALEGAQLRGVVLELCLRCL